MQVRLPRVGTRGILARMSATAAIASPRKPRIGVFGGTFDPVHCGHLALARAALGAFALDRILFVPGHVTPFKQDARTASDADRLAMLRLAVADEPRFDISTIELDRGGVSYTVDTLEALHAAHPDWALWLLLGADSLRTLGTWRRAADIVRIATVGALRRPGVALPPTIDGFSPEVSRRLLANVAEGDCPDISSTQVRQHLAAGESLKGLVPPAVADYLVRCAPYAVLASDLAVTSL